MKNNKKTFGIIGLGRFGFSLAKDLSEGGMEIIVVDCNESKIRDVSQYTENAFVVQELSQQALSECGIQNCDVVFICIGEKIDTSILTTLNVIEMGVKQVVSKAISLEQGTVLERLGAEVVYPERDMALRISKRFTSSHILEYISLSNDYDITELRISHSMHDKTVEELGIRQKYGLNIIAIKKQDETILTDITPDMRLEDHDTIVVCGTKAGIQKFENL